MGWIRYRTRVPLILSFFFISTEFSSSNGSSELIWFVCSFSCRCFLRRVLPSFFEIRNQGKTKKKRKKFQKNTKTKENGVSSGATALVFQYWLRKAKGNSLDFFDGISCRRPPPQETRRAGTAAYCHLLTVFLRRNPRKSKQKKNLRKSRYETSEEQNKTKEEEDPSHSQRTTTHRSTENAKNKKKIIFLKIVPKNISK